MAYLVYLKMETFLREWLEWHYGNPVKFPDKSRENAVLRMVTRKRGAGEPPRLRVDGDAAITLPESKAHPPAVFHSLSERGEAAVREMVRDLFKRALWNDLAPLEDGSGGTGALLSAWCENNGIGLDRVDTVRQIYYRMRSAHCKKGVNLRNFGRKKEGRECGNKSE